MQAFFDDFLFRGFWNDTSRSTVLWCCSYRYGFFLSLHDIITNEENGLIIPNGDISAFTKALLD